jgi:hypothetical protein
MRNSVVYLTNTMKKLLPKGILQVPIDEMVPYHPFTFAIQIRHSLRVLTQDSVVLCYTYRHHLLLSLSWRRLLFVSNGLVIHLAWEIAYKRTPSRFGVVSLLAVYGKMEGTVWEAQEEDYPWRNNN